LTAAPDERPAQCLAFEWQIGDRVIAGLATPLVLRMAPLAKPADLLVTEPVKFDLVVNLSSRHAWQREAPKLRVVAEVIG